MSRPEAVMKKTYCPHGYPRMLCITCSRGVPCMHGQYGDCVLCAALGSRSALWASNEPVATHTATTKSVPTIPGVIAAGGELSANTILAINEAAKDVPKQWKRYIAYKDMVKVGGSLAWRANNPGNLRDASTKIAKVPGASGTFAVFATLEDGHAAQKSLYLNKYGDQTVEKAIEALTPPSENDTAKYRKDLESQGINLKGTVRSQIDLLMVAVKKNEGLIKGKEVPRVP